MHTVPNLTSVLVLACLFLWSGVVASGQESSAPRVELLTMNGGKPNLSATGEGITSYKIVDLFKRGTTRVTLVKAEDTPFKFELPPGYSIFNNLIYKIETDASVSGPTDITFSLPSASTKKTFDGLRILYPELNHADPQVPGWIDATIDTNNRNRDVRWLSESETKQRLRDFETRTLHALTEAVPLVLVVALRDPAKVRDKFATDLAVSGTAASQVIEGRSVTYELKITNNGPDTATNISLHAVPTFKFVSVIASHEKCSMAGENVYCKFSRLEKGQTIDVKIVERCAWGKYFSDYPGYEPPIHSASKYVTVGSIEQDPFHENNDLSLTTEVIRDSNKGPVIEVLSTGLPQLFQGPAATVPVRFKATDPDGFVKKVEVFAEGKSIGEPTLRSDGEYELLYKDVPFGDHSVAIVATDNLGRVETGQLMFFVNGPAQVEITSPKTGSRLNKADGEITVMIHATSPSRLKKVSLGFWNSDATAVGNDDYVVKLKNCTRPCRLQAQAVDVKGIKTLSESVELTILDPPKTKLLWSDGESWHEFEAGKPIIKKSELILSVTAEREHFYGADVKKIEIFADGELIFTDDSPVFGDGGHCIWKPAPGKYKLQAVATDADGALGKSDPIEVIIER